ncbi:MAG TPA: fibronectin type III domain-containing protein [Patescibacteria group bacterium]|nr:fibronectin type III domain-containing protein [Patescibacteria group bacterium]
MKKENKIPTILGIIILLAGTFLGVFYLNMTQVFKIGASPQTAPKDIRLSNINDSSATISWVTDGETTDFLNWGTTQNNVSQIEKEDNQNSKFFVHSITLTGLTANTNYYYKINSNGTSYDSGGIPWQFTTGSTLDLNKSSMPVSGSVITPSGQPAKRALVYLNLSGYLASTLTSDTGNFVLQLANIRSNDLKSYVQIDPKNSLLEISVQSGQDGVSSAKIFPQSANPIPAMVLGQVYDLRNLPPNLDGQSPGVNLQLPESATPESKFNTENSTGSGKPTSVILENITEGETVTSTQPQFFGKGPAGENLTITVHSETPITDTVQVPNNGSWSWTPPAGLSAGAHTITISWIDVSGITRSLTRDFIVQAGEAPAFTASQSGATATPKALQSASPEASPTATPKATITPKPTASASAQPVPVTGELTPTLVLSIMGIAIMIFSFAVWKLAEN